MTKQMKTRYYQGQWESSMSLADLKERVDEMVEKYGPDARYIYDDNGWYEVSYETLETEVEAKAREAREAALAEQQKQKRHQMFLELKAEVENI